MKIKNLLSIILVFCALGTTKAQDDLLNQLDAGAPKQDNIEIAAFKGLQICNMQSTKLPGKGEFYFIVSHRFGDLAQGMENFFGLDNAYTKLGGIYGVSNWFAISASRHTFQKTFELATKYKIANQEEEGFPLTIVGYNTMDINSELKKNDIMPGLQFNHRLAFTTQLLVSRKFNDSFSFEVAPIYVHKNLYDGILDQKSTLLLGTGARYKIAKRLSLNLEYAARLNLPEGFISNYSNPLTLGLDIETGGHVFQLVFSNSQAMNDVAVFTNANGRWDGTKQLYFGFNMYRVF
jgi:hypothetical protein